MILIFNSYSLIIEYKDALCLVLTLLNGGDLKFHLYTLCPGGFDERRVQFYASEITLGLHDKLIILNYSIRKNICINNNCLYFKAFNICTGKRLSTETWSRKTFSWTMMVRICPLNILFLFFLWVSIFFTKGHCRISDLGLAVELKDNKPISGRVGTVGYMGFWWRIFYSEFPF